MTTDANTTGLRVDIPSETHRRLKVYAALRSMKMKDAVLLALQRLVAEEKESQR